MPQQEHWQQHLIQCQHYGTQQLNNTPQHLSQPSVGKRKVLHQRSQLHKNKK
jgi:hypothetical protein